MDIPEHLANWPAIFFLQGFAIRLQTLYDPQQLETNVLLFLAFICNEGYRDCKRLSFSLLVKARSIFSNCIIHFVIVVIGKECSGNVWFFFLWWYVGIFCLLLQGQVKKEEPASLFQQRRVDSLLEDLQTRFPYKYPTVPQQPQNAQNQPQEGSKAGMCM